LAAKVSAVIECGEGCQVVTSHGVENVEAGSRRPANQQIPGFGQSHDKGR